MKIIIEIAGYEQNLKRDGFDEDITVSFTKVDKHPEFIRIGDEDGLYTIVALTELYQAIEALDAS